MMLSFVVDNLKFNYRVAAIIINKGKVLFQRSENQDFWFLPGGRVEFLETAEESLKREMVEEYNLTIEQCRLYTLVENFFELNGTSYHEIGLFFTAVIPEDHPITDHSEEFISLEEGFFHKWIPLAELITHIIYPEFLREKLLELSLNPVNNIAHIINRTGDR